MQEELEQRVARAEPSPPRADGPDGEDYRRLVELCPDPIVVHNGRAILFVNPATVELLGAPSREALVGKPVLELVHPDYMETVKARIQRVYQERTPGPLLEEQFLRLDGTPVVVEAANTFITFDGQPAIQVIGRDITERKRAEAELQRLNEALKQRNEEVEAAIASRTAELRQRERRYRAVVEHAGVGIALIDAEGRVLESNRVLQGMLGLEAEALSGGLIGSFFPEEDRIQSAEFRRTARLGDSYQRELRLERPGQEPLWVSVVSSAVDETVDGDRLFVCLVEDITTRKEFEAALTAQNAQLRKTHQLKNDFVNAVSHELRTPLTSIVGYAEFLEEQVGGPLTETQQEFVGQLKDGARRLQRLVDDLLDFARLEAGTFRLAVQEFDLTRRLHEVVESLKPQARARAISLETRFPEAPVQVHGDADRLGQVVINLLGNALKFTPPGGGIEVRLAASDEAVRVEVADSGIGIPPDHLPHLFQKFYQVDSGPTRERGGAGLGLSIAKALVEAHNGAIGVESTPGSGTTFWITLPVSRA